MYSIYVITVQQDKKMQQRRMANTIFVTALFAMSQAVLTARSSLITYSAATYAANSTDWLTGTPELAIKFGGATTTFGGESFLGTTDNGHHPGETYASNGTLAAFHSIPGIAWANVASGTFDPVGGSALLQDGTWRPDATGTLVDLNGLTIGLAYEVQFVLADSRGASAGRQIELLGVGAYAGQNSGAQTFAFTDGRFTVFTAAFIADQTSLNIEPRMVGGGGSHINALRVVVVPEAGTAGLMVIAGVVGLLRRFRIPGSCKNCF